MSRCILFVVDAMILGGGPVVCYNLIRSLNSTHFNPCVIALFSKGPLGERLESEGVPLLCLNLRRPFRLTQIRKFLPEIVSFARAHNVCLVHAHLMASGLYGGLAARTLGVPAVFTAHGELSRRFPLCLVEVGIRHLSGTLVGVSRCGEAEIRRYSLFRKGRRFLHIYNGIDTLYWTRDAYTADRFPKDEKRICITMVANFFREKDHRTAIESFRLFSAKYANSLLTLAGEGEERTRVEGWAREMGLQNVVFAGEVEDIKALLARTDIFILSSLSEGFGIAVVEAMAMELPVVASDVGGMREIITHEVDGVLVPPKDPGALFKALDKLVRQPMLRESIGKKARERVVSTFSLDTMTNAYLSLYRELMEPRR